MIAISQSSCHWFNPQHSPVVAKSKSTPPTPAASTVAVEIPTPTGARYPLAYLTPESCQGKPLQMQLSFQTQLGHHDLVLEEKSAQFLVRVEGGSFQLEPPMGLALQPRALCASTRTEAESQTLRGQMEALLHALVPECKPLTLSTDGWHCQLPQLSEDSAHAALSKLRLEMISHWRQQPYLLLRKVILATTLAHQTRSAVQKQSTSPFHDFCRVLNASLEKELPLAFQNPTWKETLCKNPDLPRMISVARFGLSKAWEEVNFAARLVEEGTQLGQLHVQIPASEHPGKGQNIFVRLSPEEEVLSNLVLTAQSFHTVPAPATEQAPRLSTCWQPGFSSENLEITSLLEKKQGACRTTAMATHVHGYLTEILLGETQFAVGNGKYKTLRLPQGRYRYRLSSKPGLAPSEHAIPDAHAAALLEWPGRANGRGSATISSWGHLQ